MRDFDQAQEMIFCEYACVPQVPSVAAVRIALTESGRVYYDIGRISEEDGRMFWFCEANAMSFTDNARLCARRLSSSFGDSLIGLLFNSTRADDLDRVITETLISMCLERVEKERRSEVERALRAMGQWDADEAAIHLVNSL